MQQHLLINGPKRKSQMREMNPGPPDRGGGVKNSEKKWIHVSTQDPPPLAYHRINLSDYRQVGKPSQYQIRNQVPSQAEARKAG